VKLSFEDLSSYSNKTESAGLRKCPYYYYLTKKVIGYHNNKHFSELAPHHGRKTTGIDMVRRNYVTVTIMYISIITFRVRRSRGEMYNNY